MTIRLVGLMGLVLLISLAALALLTNSYQEEVMDGVTRTISEASRATLRTFDYRFSPAANDDRAIEDARVRLRASHDLLMEFTGADGDGEPLMREMASLGPHGVSVVVVSQFGEPQAAGAPHPACGDGVAGCDAASGHELLQVHKRIVDAGERTTDADGNAFFIQVDQVRAEADPGKGTVLRIPTLFRRESTWVAAAGEPGVEASEGASVGAAPGARHQVHGWAMSSGGDASPARAEILLPIETDEFQALFSSFRQRTLLMFVGVFLLGMVLSASLATRFTRPVRRLDAGIRRLTDGDLDVQVEAHGRDEVGRLGRAFNEMARRLRAGKERERDLTRREKLSALGRLAAGVAHDVRNPLHSIGLTLQHLRETCRPEEEGRGREFERALDIIRGEIHRLDRLVGNFLQFARSDRRSRATIDLVQLLRETAILVEKEAERRGIRVQIVTDGDARPFAADAESIRSSILNLVMNSFEAMEDGGTLSLRVGGSADEVLVEVADTGRGIPAEDQERVFEFAYTTREDGHGLGLAMVHQVVVEDHGGRVSLESRPGEGTRVRLAFPLSPAGATA